MIEISAGPLRNPSWRPIRSCLPGGLFLSVSRMPIRRRWFRLSRSCTGWASSSWQPHGTSMALSKAGINNQIVKKIAEGRPHILDHIKNNAIHLVINTASGNAGASSEIRRTVLRYDVPYSTTISGAWAMVSGIESLIQGDVDVKSVQEYNKING